MKFTTRFIKPFFFSKEDSARIKVPYLISTVMILLTIVAVLSQLVIVAECYRQRITMQWDLVPLIAVLMSSAGIFIAVYNKGKNK